MGRVSPEVEAVATELAGRLALQRPLVFIDLETTGTKAQTDHIVEIAVLKVSPAGPADLVARLVNPLMPIPPEATTVHGITDEDVSAQPEFRRIARGLAAYLEGCDLAGFNVARFDLRILQEEFRRVGVPFSIEDRRVADGMAVFFQREPRDLSAAMRFYRGKELEGAHGAGADVVASMEVLPGQLDRYHDLATNLEELDRIAAPRRPEPDWLDMDGKLAWVESDACINFGRHKGARLTDLAATNADYLDRILHGDFSDEVKSVVTKVRAGIAVDR